MKYLKYFETYISGEAGYKLFEEHSERILIIVDVQKSFKKFFKIFF